MTTVLQLFTNYFILICIAFIIIIPLIIIGIYYAIQHNSLPHNINYFVKHGQCIGKLKKYRYELCLLYFVLYCNKSDNITSKLSNIQLTIIYAHLFILLPPPYAKYFYNNAIVQKISDNFSYNFYPILINECNIFLAHKKNMILEICIDSMLSNPTGITPLCYDILIELHSKLHITTHTLDALFKERSLTLEKSFIIFNITAETEISTITTKYQNLLQKYQIDFTSKPEELYNQLVEYIALQHAYQHILRKYIHNGAISKI